MNDPLTMTAQAGADKEEPPSWLKRLWAKTQEKLHGNAEVMALHEAVDEILEESQASDGSPTVERVFLDNILSFRDKEVGDCMVPRAQIVAIEVDSDLKDLVDLMVEHTHSRIPAYRETLDETVGMVHMKDVLACLASGKTCRIRDLLRPLVFAAPSMPASKLLLQMMQSRKHMAMVIDEFGGIDGLVTIEDLVEEIVGEIEDEHDDPEVPEIMARPDGTLLVEASIDIEDFEDRVGSLLTQEERETIDTLAGYIFHLAGHIPAIGETIEGGRGLLFDILETDQNRIKRVRVRGTKKVEV
ncbi:MAG: hemolysin family protein [Alphaproteobacteria bacterium]|nr:hemolysin family protein [Alphaproteobacteria bacterium]